MFLISLRYELGTGCIAGEVAVSPHLISSQKKCDPEISLSRHKIRHEMMTAAVIIGLLQDVSSNNKDHETTKKDD